MAVKVIKSIRVEGYNDIEYTLVTEGGSYIAVYANEIGQEYNQDNPIMYLHSLEAKALSRALADIASPQ